MRILVDTSAWIDFFRGRENRVAHTLEDLIREGEDLCTCGVVLTEVLQGIKVEKDRRKVSALLDDLIYLPMERSTFLLAADLYRALRADGTTLRATVDGMIAAVAMEQGAAILHRDRDFDAIARKFKLSTLP